MKKTILGMSVMALMLIGCGSDDNTTTVEPGDTLVVSKYVDIECGVPFTFRAIGAYGGTVVGVMEGDVIQTLSYEDGEVVKDEKTTTYNNEWGVDVTYTVITPCPVDKNETVDPTKPIDGNCQEGWELNDCATLCTEIPKECVDGTILDTKTNECVIEDPKCDIGMVLDPETEECVAVTKPITCGEGTSLDKNGTQCIITPPGDCGDGLVWNPKTELCDVISEPEPVVCGNGLTNVEDECLATVYLREGKDCADGYVEGQKGIFCFLKSGINGPTPK